MSHLTGLPFSVLAIARETVKDCVRFLRRFQSSPNLRPRLQSGEILVYYEFRRVTLLELHCTARWNSYFGARSCSTRKLFVFAIKSAFENQKFEIIASPASFGASSQRASSFEAASSELRTKRCCKAMMLELLQNQKM